MEKIKGTWLMIKSGDDYSKPELIEFETNKVLYFEVTDESNNGNLKKIKTRTENLSETKIELINANRIRFYREGKLHKVFSETESITEDKIFEVDYERIEPTKTELTKNQIEKLQFIVEWNERKIPFVFNKELDSPIIQEINKKINREGRKLILENLDGTYFGAIYEDRNREILIPIREINEKTIVVYGFPKEPYEIIGN
jgi:hypothetical protein